MDLLRVLDNVSKVLTTLTKIRCSVDSIRSSDIKCKREILAWPLHFEKNQDLLNYLKTNKIIPNKKLSVLAYEVTYDTYKNLKGSTKIDINEMMTLRNCITIEKIINIAEGPIELGLTWKDKKTNSSEFPTNSLDQQRIIDIKNRRDTQYTFNPIPGYWKTKAPACLGPIVFNELSLFHNQKILFKDSSEITGKNVDNRGRANRILIKKSDTEMMKKILETTQKNIQVVMQRQDWYKKVKEATYEYYDKELIY